MIKSKFSLFVYLVTIGYSAFISLGLYFLFHPQMQLHNKFGGTNSAAVPGLILVVILGFGLYWFLKRVFVLTFDQDQLSVFSNFTRKTVERKDIRSIILTDRCSVYSIRADALTIQMVDGRLFILPDQLCSNMPELKGMLLDKYGEFVLDPPVRKDKFSLQTREVRDPEEFYGNAILSLNGILLAGISIGCFLGGVSILKTTSSAWKLLLTLIPIVMFCGALGGQLFYFRLSNDCLEIRNHLFRWYEKQYMLEDIASVVFERIPKRSNALRIRTNDFRSRSYAAGSLRDKNWKALEQALKDRGIPVKNELL